MMHKVWVASSTPGLMGMIEASGACLVFINAFATEDVGCGGARDDYSYNLANKIGTSNIMVIIHYAGAHLVDKLVLA